MHREILGAFFLYARKVLHMSKVSFRNDYSILMHPAVYAALGEHLHDVHVGYGRDEESEQARTMVRDLFGLKNDSEVHFLAGGTQTNMVALSYILKDYQAVIACSSGHINVHEAGAVEASGHKILVSPGVNGKLSAAEVEKIVLAHPDEHVVEPKAIYISDSTETGTVYTKEELLALRKVANQYGLYLFLDGARLGAALTSEANDLSPKDIGALVDAFYLGGTKNGLPFGEALVLIHPDFKNSFLRHVKARGAMLAKGYALGIMFKAILNDGLYFDLARKANSSAKKLLAVLEDEGYVPLPSPTNQVFCAFPNSLAMGLIGEFGCELWEKRKDSTVIRFVTSYETSKEDILVLHEFLKNHR